MLYLGSCGFQHHRNSYARSIVTPQYIVPRNVQSWLYDNVIASSFIVLDHSVVMWAIINGHVATTTGCDDLGKDSGASHGVEGIGS